MGADDASAGSWLARARSNLQVMYRTALAVSHTLDIDQLLQRIMELIFEWVEADRGCIMLIDADTDELVPKVRRSRQKNVEGEKITISKTILDYVTERNEGVLTSDAREDERWTPAASIFKAGIREAICVPMQGRYDVVGVIYIDTSTPAEEAVRTGRATKFKEDHLKLMIAIAHQAALAVEDTRYYSAMVQAERLAAMGQTIASLSHHIKNILQGIRGGSYLIEMGLEKEDPSVTQKGWKIVEKNQNKISALVMDMLTFSKEREPDRAPADLNEVVSDVIELMNSRAEELDVELHWQPDAGLEQMVFDAEGISREVLNVVTNALDAAHENEGRGEVYVSSGKSDDAAHVWIAIEDNGSGIPEEVKENLFSPFVSSKGSRGTGLGLPVSQKILTEHGGRIEVEDLSGQGTRFTLEMPIVPVPPSE
ncbi:MAG: GAF domain-containing protein [Pirellulales bacterium]|nr:GAF domain-containing protein [Pirellulales bacterium]